MKTKNILALVGSVRKESANSRLVKAISDLYADTLTVKTFDALDKLPYFNPDFDTEDIETVDPTVASLRQEISQADGVIFCTPEYVFSIPGILKNALEWLVSTTTLLDKPVVLIVASLGGEKTFESLQTVVRTLGGKFDDNTAVLLQGARAKITPEGAIADAEAKEKIAKAMDSFIGILP